MRTFAALALLYVLFLVQASLPAWWPDLVLVLLVACAFHETKLTSTLLGAFAGFCVDMTAPAYIGVGVVTYALAGYGVAAVRKLFYRARWATLLLALAALLVKWVALSLLGAGLPPAGPMMLSSAVTLLLVPVADGVAGRLLYHGWQAA